MPEDISPENPKAPDSTAAQQADDLSRAAMAEIAGYASVTPLTPKEWEAPGTAEAAKTTSETVAYALMLPIPGLEEAGIAAKLFESSVNLYRRITGAIHFAGEIEAGHQIIPHAEIEPPPAVPELGSKSGVTVARFGISNDEATQLAQDMYRLKDPTAINQFIRVQFALKGPRVLETIESVLNAAKEQDPFALKFHVQPGTEEAWEQSLSRFTQGEWGKTWKTIANLDRESDIIKFVKDLANGGKLDSYANDIKGAVSRGWVRPGTKTYWSNALQAATSPQ